MIALLALLASGVARADVPPPEGYVERCTVEVCGAEEPKRCRSMKIGLERPECEALERAGYVSKCRGGGATVGWEILCKPKADTAPTPRTTTEPGQRADLLATAGQPISEESARVVPGAEGEPSATPPPSQPSAPSSVPAPAASGGCASVPMTSTRGTGFLGVAALFAALGAKRRKGA